MAQQIANGVCRSLEWTLVALMCGCFLWVTLVAYGFAPQGA